MVHRGCLFATTLTYLLIYTSNFTNNGKEQFLHLDCDVYDSVGDGSCDNVARTHCQLIVLGCFIVELIQQYHRACTSTPAQLSTTHTAQHFNNIIITLHNLAVRSELLL